MHRSCCNKFRVILYISTAMEYQMLGQSCMQTCEGHTGFSMLDSLVLQQAMEDHDEMIANFTAITGSDSSTAQRLLEVGRPYELLRIMDVLEVHLKLKSCSHPR